MIWPALTLISAAALEAFQAGHAGSIPVARSVASSLARRMIRLHTLTFRSRGEQSSLRRGLGAQQSHHDEVFPAVRV